MHRKREGEEEGEQWVEGKGRKGKKEEGANNQKGKGSGAWGPQSEESEAGAEAGQDRTGQDRTGSGQDGPKRSGLTSLQGFKPSTAWAARRRLKLTF